MLMTEKGEFITANFGSRFSFSCLNEKINLNAGKYIIMIDPLWNDTVDNDDMYREVLIDIYGPEGVNLDPVEDARGMQYLANALKHAAKNRAPVDSRQTYLEENEDYGTDVIRISDVECLDCWYGFIYTQNNSKYALRETIRPALEGLVVVYPDMVNEEDIEFSIEPGQDHIVILRRVSGSCRYGLQYMTHQRDFSDAEMVEFAKSIDDEEAAFFENSKAFYKLFNTDQCAVFYFENLESKRTLVARFEMAMENLYIQGEPEGASDFTINLAPGKNCFKILKPVERGQQT